MTNPLFVNWRTRREGNRHQARAEAMACMTNAMLRNSVGKIDRANQRHGRGPTDQMCLGQAEMSTRRRRRQGCLGESAPCGVNEARPLNKSWGGIIQLTFTSSSVRDDPNAVETVACVRLIMALETSQIINSRRISFNYPSYSALSGSQHRGISPPAMPGYDARALCTASSTILNSASNVTDGL
jgi:hypothetical protein